jgi:hypothetical protein
MWPDNETVIDLLGFDVHRDLLAGLATNRNLLPVTVGLFGDWGGGKSSVMRMLKDRLDAEDGVACLYFNGWTFEGYDDAKTALIASILIELAEHERIGPKIRGKVVGLLKRVNYLRMASVIFKHGPQALSGAVGLAAMTGFIDPHMAAAIAAGTAGLSHVGAGLAGAVAAVCVGAASGYPWSVPVSAWPTCRAGGRVGTAR